MPFWLMKTKGTRLYLELNFSALSYFEGQVIPSRASVGEDPIEALDGIPFRDLSRPIAQSMQEEWQRQWNGTGNNKLKEIKPMLRKQKYRSFKERWKEVVLARICIGHSRLTHGYLIEKVEPPKYENCDKQLTIKHIIGECPKYNLIRKKKVWYQVQLYRHNARR